MANMYWPPEKALKYQFNDELELEIPLVDNRKIEKGKEKEDNDAR